MAHQIFKICFYVPKSHVEIVKSALFQTGAGRYKNYDCASWQTLGEGQFRPLEGSAPFMGEKEQIEKVPEFKVEMICSEERLSDALAALKKSHPYEEPAYEVYAIQM